MLPTISLAANYDITANNSTVTLSDYSFSSGDTITIADDLTVTVDGGGVTYSNISIICGSNVNLTINNVSISNTASIADLCPIAFTGGTNSLTLVGSNGVSSNFYQPGVKVEGTTALTIGGDGSLMAQGFYSAGIGGSSGENGGSITITGGTITAYGTNGAGIGGGSLGDNGTVRITGGTVNAQSSMRGAGIGGGVTGDGGTIIIDGGNVSASCNNNGGAGIGGGGNDSVSGNGGGGGNITITGGTVTASGSDGGAGIGGGSSGSGSGTAGGSVGSVSISNASVTAKGDRFGEEIGSHGGAGIGGGAGGGTGGNAGTVTITNSYVTATGRTGIGGGYGGTTGGNGGAVSISGSTVSAQGAETGYDVGGGDGAATGSGGSLSVDDYAILRLRARGVNAASSVGTGAVAGASGGALSGAYVSGEKLSGTVIDIGDVESGSGYTCTSGGSYGEYIFTVIEDGVYILIGSSWANKNVIIDSGVSADVTLFNSTIINNDTHALSMTGAAVDMTLYGSNTLQSNTRTALLCPAGATLTIQGGGSLEANGGDAGIGGGLSHTDGGTVTIKSGTIHASGGVYGAGIGGGNGGDGGTIRIEGGSVTATGGSHTSGSYTEAGSAGIGGGCYRDGGTITITGGTVTSTGGTVSATGGYHGAGIGAGANGMGSGWFNTGTGSGTGAIIISDTADVTAQGGEGAAGIGGGYGNTAATLYHPEGGTGGTINILGGAVTATGGDNGAGIGSGHLIYGPADADATLTISGGTVTAEGGTDGAGLGGGNLSSGGVIDISDGIVYSEGNGGQDIGSGSGGSGGSFSISGSAAAFLANNSFLTPMSGTHSHVDITGHGGGMIYGISVPWTGDFGAYLRVYTLSYDINDGTGTTPESVTRLHNMTTSVSDDSGFSRANYTFDGWNTEADGNGTAYTAGSSLTFAENTTLYAQWTVESFTITYDLDGGTVASANPANYTIESESITLNNPTRAGFVFTGWSGTDITGTSQSVTIPGGSAGNRSYTAHWTPAYTINYDLDGGTVTPANPTVYTADDLPFTLSNPTKAGYVFAGWSGTDITGTSQSVTIPGGSTGNRSYTAHWTAVPYTISYDLDGGTVALVNPASYTIESQSIILNNPTKAGFVFTGWSGTGITGTSKSVTISGGSIGNRSYTAHWAAAYTINYDLDGGTVTPANPTVYTADDLPFTLSNPTKAGYVFAGWSGTDITGTSQSVTIPGGSTGNRSYTAHWTAVPYTISYDLDGGTVASANPASYTIESESIILNNPTKAGYVFDGWSGTGITGTSKSVTISGGSTGDRSYTAHWTAVVYTINYELDGGTVSPANPTSYTADNLPLTLRNPTKAGFAFAGWSDTGILGTSASVTLPIGTTGNKEYTAHWDVVPAGYEQRTLTDSASGITVSGIINGDAVLTVSDITLGSDDASDAIRQRMNNNNYLMVFGKDISLSGEFAGTLTITVSVDPKYNGQQLTALHSINGVLETLTSTVVNGQATFAVTSLSPFAVFVQTGSDLDNVPDTGDGRSNFVWWLLGGLSLAGIALLIILSMKKAAKR